MTRQLPLLDVPPQSAPAPSDEERLVQFKLDIAGRAALRLRRRQRAERELHELRKRAR
jgi:hypothetical protein